MSQHGFAPRDDCKGARCAQDICSDGKPRRPIGKQCCACPKNDCKGARCAQDLCSDGKPRRPIGKKCCACPGKWKRKKMANIASKEVEEDLMSQPGFAPR